MAADVTIPNTLTNGTTNDAAAVMTNLTTLRDWINANVVHLDGAKATTGVLSGPNADPTSANQYTRKAYVDAQDLAPPRVGTIVTNGAGTSVLNGNNTQVSFTTEISDSDNYITVTSNTVTIPASRAGLYLLSAVASIAANASTCSFTILVNGTQVGIDGLDLDFTGATVRGEITRAVVLAVGDTVTVFCANQSGSTRTFVVELDVQRLSV